MHKRLPDIIAAGAGIAMVMGMRAALVAAGGAQQHAHIADRVRVTKQRKTPGRAPRRESRWGEQINLRNRLSRAYWCGCFSCSDRELIEAVLLSAATRWAWLGCTWRPGTHWNRSRSRAWSKAGGLLARSLELVDPSSSLGE